jgi:hypothetical protein
MVLRDRAHLADFGFVAFRDLRIHCEAKFGIHNEYGYEFSKLEGWRRLG